LEAGGREDDGGRYRLLRDLWLHDLGLRSGLGLSLGWLLGELDGGGCGVRSCGELLGSRLGRRCRCGLAAGELSANGRDGRAELGDLGDALDGELLGTERGELGDELGLEGLNGLGAEICEVLKLGAIHLVLT